MAVNNVQISNNIQSQQVSQNKTSVGTTSSANNIGIGTNNAELELLKRLGITKEQLEVIVSKCSDFYNLSPEKQVEIVSQVNTPQSVEPAEKTTTESTSATAQTTEEESTQNSEPDAVKFDNKNFANLSNEEKVKVYAEELAKNKFLYTDSENKKTTQDWNALSDTQRQELINTELKALEKQYGKSIKGEDLSKLLQLGMTGVQAANFYETTIDELNKRGLEAQNEAVHDYIFSLPKEKRTAGQQKYIEIQEHKSKLLCEYAKSKGVELNANMPPNEITERAKELGIDIIDLEIQDLENKKTQNKGQLSTDEQSRLDQLNKQKKFNEIIEQIQTKEKDGKFAPSGLLDNFEGSDFAKTFNALDSSDIEKCKAVLDYVNTLPKDQKSAETLSSFFLELKNKNPELAMQVAEFVIGNSSVSEQKAFVQSKDFKTQAITACAVNILDEATATELATSQKAMRTKDAKMADELAIFTQNTADGTHLTRMSEVYSKFGSEKVESNLGDRAYNNDVVNQEQQATILQNINKNSCQKARIHAATNLDKAYDNNQLPLQEQFCQDKAVQDAMVQDGTYTRYKNPETQLAGFELHQKRYQQGDYSQAEIDKGLTTLAGQIKNCDVSVQSKAIESIVASGNSNATEIALSNLATSAPSVVQDEANLKGILYGAYTENVTASTDKTELQQKIASGARLTPQEYYSLSDKEKLEYKTNYFKSLPPAKQIAMLSNLTDVSMKKTIFKKLINQDKNFFRSLVESDATTAEFAYNMHIGEEIVMEVANRKAASDIKFALLSQKIDKDYQKKNSLNSLATSSNYTTTPNDFDKTEIYRKDKQGHILA